MKNKLSADILEKYFRGECNDDEIAQVHSWYDSFEQEPDDVSDLSDDEREKLRLLMLGNIHGNIRGAGLNNVVNFKSNWRFRSLFYLIVGSAAVLLIVFLLKYKLPVSSPTEANEEMVVNNLTNTIQRITLSDGSKVWLSPNSQLTYLKVFAKNSRLVAMNGEAFFEVTKDHARPFSIYSGNVITKVWGTSFRIRSYKNNLTKVDVVTGKVSVSVPRADLSAVDLNKPVETDLQQEVMLMPNQEATYDKQLNALKKNVEIRDTTLIIWKKTNISFDNTPMREAFKMLSKKFKVHISSDDQKVNADYLNADFTDESLPAIMEMMKKTLNVNYVVNGNEFVLERNK